LGFNPGDDGTIADWDQITDYFARLDKASDRVMVETVGRSTLQRPLIAVFISARENLLALDRYKQIQQKLSDPRTVASDAERERLVTDGKLVVAISCSIHSTEIVASQMALQLAYELAISQDSETREILQNTILLLLPSPNPDGIDIVSKWYRKTLGTPYEGKEPPELYHHYAGHDDNRDWFMLNLKETQAITHLFWKEWFPEIIYDVHQQSSTGPRFFIPPFYDPPNPNIAPLLLRQVGLIGQKMAADLQAAGFRGVLTNAEFDTWWHGGFRTVPYFHNSIGILSEAASCRLMSPATITHDQLSQYTTRGLRNPLEPTTNFPDPWAGGTWKPRDIMNMELIAVRAVLSLAAKYRKNYLANFYNLNVKCVNDAIKAGEPMAYLIPAGQARDEAVARLVGILLEQGIEIYRLDHELHASYGPEVLQRTNSENEKVGLYRKIIHQTVAMPDVPAGSYIVFVSQPQRENVLSLFEPQIYPNRIPAAGEVERPYDVTGWTLPMQMDVAAPAVIAIEETAAQRQLSKIRDENEVRKDLALRLKSGNQSPIPNPVKAPVRVGLYRGWVVNTDEGWTRYVFDTFNVPYRSVSDARIRQGYLSSEFDVLLLSSQPAREIMAGNARGTYPQEFTGGITAAGVLSLKKFAEDGGTLICFGESCELPIKQFSLPLRNVLEGLKPSDFYCPGSIVSLDIDNNQALTRGMSQNLDAYFLNSSAFDTNDSRVRIIARYAKDNVLRSGWLLGEENLKNRIALAEVSLGKGRIVLFGFRPQHRGQTWGTLPLIWNAIASSRQHS